MDIIHLPHSVNSDHSLIDSDTVFDIVRNRNRSLTWRIILPIGSKIDWQDLRSYAKNVPTRIEIGFSHEIIAGIALNVAHVEQHLQQKMQQQLCVHHVLQIKNTTIPAVIVVVGTDLIIIHYLFCLDFINSYQIIYSISLNNLFI
jgi:hypothetical protein